MLYNRGELLQWSSSGEMEHLVHLLQGDENGQWEKTSGGCRR